MDDMEIRQKLANVWKALEELRSFRVKVLISCILGAVAIGIAYGEARLAIAQNTKEIEARKSAIKKVEKLADNQQEIAKGVNHNGKALQAIADKLDVKLPNRPVVTIKNGDSD